MAVPREAADLLREQRLLVLCTSFEDHPHASLMAFTYLPDEDAVVFATRKDTTKARNIQRNPRVSLLVFRPAGDPGAALSCTIGGTARFLAGDAIEGYRALHRQRHPHMPPFTEGDALALVRVDFDRISLANAEDCVRRFPT